MGFGIEKSAIKPCVGTGLVVDIVGTGPAQVGVHEGCKVVALRADMDGLPMKENNQSLPYKTTTNFAHMCGHDGHMAILLSAAQVI